MNDTTTCAKKRAEKKVEPSTSSASASKKLHKRTPEQRVSAVEAQRQNKANRAAKFKKKRSGSIYRVTLVKRDFAKADAVYTLPPT